MKLWVFSSLIFWLTLSANQILLSQDWIVVHEGVGISVGDFGFSQLHFPDASNGWALSFQDPSAEQTEVTIIYTKNGGITWNDRALKHKELIGIDYKPRAVYFLNAQEGWVGGMNNVIHTTDGGQSWQTIKVDYEEKPQVHTHGALREVSLAISRIYFANSQEGWVAGHGQILSDYYGPFILYTENAGGNWEAQVPVSSTPKPGQFTALDFISPHQGWVAGWEVGDIVGGIRGIVLNTYDGGLSWDVLPDLPDIVMDIRFADSQNGWVLTQVSWASSYIHHTTDGGHSWLEQNISGLALHKLQDGLLYALDFANNKEGWAVGSRGVIVHTRDAGIHWTLQESPVDVQLVDVQYVPDNGVFALGNDGTVLRLNLEEPASLISLGKKPATWAELKKGKANKGGSQNAMHTRNTSGNDVGTDCCGAR